MTDLFDPWYVELDGWYKALLALTLAVVIPFPVVFHHRGGDLRAGLFLWVILLVGTTFCILSIRSGVAEDRLDRLREDPEDIVGGGDQA